MIIGGRFKETERERERETRIDASDGHSQDKGSEEWVSA